MSLENQLNLLAVTIAVSTVLLGLWMEGGLAAAIVGAALTDLGLRVFERRRTKVAAPIKNKR